MIQRIQSLFLFLVDIVLVVLLFVPNAKTTITLFEEPASTDLTLLDQTPLLVGQILLCMLAAATMAMYRNRKLQMKLCVVGIFLSLGFTGLMAYPLMVQIPGVTYEPAAGLYISLANALLFTLARIFIKKDEEMVQSADRLR